MGGERFEWRFMLRNILSYHQLNVNLIRFLIYLEGEELSERLLRQSNQFEAPWTPFRVRFSVTGGKQFHCQFR